MGLFREFIRFLEGENRDPGPFAHLRLLLIDDDETFGLIMQRAAAREDLSLTCLTSLRKVSADEKWDYDLIILDYELENITGIQLIDFLARYARADAEIVLISAYNRIEEIKAPPHVRILSKSLGPQRIVATIKEILASIVKRQAA